jgi:uncharacterized RDD family membrane protein YckC
MQLNKKEYLEYLLKQILSEAEIDDEDVIEGFQSYLEKDDVFETGKLYGLYDLLNATEELEEELESRQYNFDYHLRSLLILLPAIPAFKSLGVLKRYIDTAYTPDKCAEGISSGRKAAAEMFKKIKIEQILENISIITEEEVSQQKNLKSSSDSSREIQEKKQPRSSRKSLGVLKDLSNFKDITDDPDAPNAFSLKNSKEKREMTPKDIFNNNENARNTKEDITTFTMDTAIKLKENEVFADIFDRFGARIIDALIIAFLIGVAVALGLFGADNQPPAYFWYIVYGTYETFLIYFNSATVGKRLFNLRVVNYYTNKKISFWGSLLRFILISIPLVPLTILFDEKSHRGWHDKLVDTVVIRDKSKSNKLGIILAIIGFGLIMAGRIMSGW